MGRQNFEDRILFQKHTWTAAFVLRNGDHSVGIQSNGLHKWAHTFSICYVAGEVNATTVRRCRAALRGSDPTATLEDLQEDNRAAETQHKR